MRLLREKNISFYLIILAIISITGAVYFYTSGKLFHSHNIKVTNAYKSAVQEKNVENEKSEAINVPAPKENQEEAINPPADNQKETASQQPNINVEEIPTTYPIHKNISATFFWVGEDAGKDNKNISNQPSAWDDYWTKHFGGVDDPAKRHGYLPADFTPKENTFYFALPYNDFDSNGKRKKEISQLAQWYGEKSWADSESVCKNQWVKIIKGGKVCYAQWEDVGPFKEDDKDYVFGNSSPKSKTNKNAGIDVSPAVKDYLGLSDIDKVDWQFVDESQVPDGEWKKIITTTQVSWN
jgi:hypothetical protein